MKANAILEKLASASVGSYGQEVWLDLVNEAKENLHKIQVSLILYFIFIFLTLICFPSRIIIKELGINFSCFLTQTG